MKETKQAIYARYGVQFDPKTGNILAPMFGWIRPLLIDGNSKLGKGVWTFSMLPGNFYHHVTVDGSPVEILGTCPCNCPGCYAQTGLFNTPDVKAANARKTALARMYLDFVKRAIMAQIKADKIKLLRIHAAGDFFSVEYINMWRDIIKATPGTIYWTYTKNPVAESAFDDLKNANVVKSLIPGMELNYGPCKYVMDAYKALKSMGKNVYICRCGIDKNQHCVNCTGCSKNEYVLFVEHSTKYKAEKDPLYQELVALIESQPPQK